MLPLPPLPDEWNVVPGAGELLLESVEEGPLDLEREMLPIPPLPVEC